MQWFGRGARIGAAVLLGCLGCSSSHGPAASSGPVEVFSWWTSGGEADALDAAILVYGQQHQAGKVVKSSILGSSGAKDQLRSRFENGSPPDLFQANGGLDLCSWVTATQNFVENIDALAARNGWTDPNVMPQAVQDSVRCVGPDGVKHFYGVPIDIHRNNTLFYNKKILAEAGVAAPPKSIEEFFQVAEALKVAKPDVAPLALGTNPAKGGTWTLSLLIFESLLPGTQGASWYLKFYTGHADLSNAAGEDSNKLRAVLDAAAKLLEYVNPNFQDLGWDEAAELLRSERAAMNVMGDWANGTYLKDGWSAAAKDGFGGRAAFGDAYVMTTDAFGLALGAPNRTGAMDFLSVVASPSGQDAFNRIKGSIPPRIAQLDPATYNEYAQGAASDFSLAGERLVPALSLVTPQAYVDAINKQLESFQVDKNVDGLTLVIRNHYGKLKGE